MQVAQNHLALLPPRRARGFTLVEVLLTVFLLGLITSLVLLNIEPSHDEVARLEAERFAALVRHVQTESVLVGYPIGIGAAKVDNGYRFYRLDEAWEAVAKDSVLRPRQLPNGVAMSLSILAATHTNPDAAGTLKRSDKHSDGSRIDAAALLVAEPNGLITPFAAWFSGETKYFHIRLDATQNVVVAASDSPS